MKKAKIRSKIFILIALIVVFEVGVNIFDFIKSEELTQVMMSHLNQLIYDTTRLQIQAEVDSIAKSLKDKISDEEFRQQFVDFIKKMQIGKFPQTQHRRVFIADRDGKIVLIPTDPELTGKNMLNRQDVRGRYFMQLMIEAAANGGGFVEYTGGFYISEYKKRLAYAQRIGDSKYIICVDIDLETVNEKQESISSVIESKSMVYYFELIGMYVTAVLILIPLCWIIIRKIIALENENLKNESGLSKAVEKLNFEIKERREAEKKAEAANRAKSEFLANISHEIRTPLNVILGFSEILESRIKEPQNQKYLSSINSSGKSLLTLINDILDLSKVEAGKLEIEYKAFDPRTVFWEITKVFSQKAADRDVELTISVDDEVPPAVILDELRFRQILLNLVGNAVKFTSEGQIQLSAHFSSAKTKKDNARFQVKVKDTGMGIPQKELETIFGVFEQQSGQSTRFGGTGLGLAITKRLTEMMDGRITVESEVDVGSTFTVTFENIGQSQTSEKDSPLRTVDLANLEFKSATVLVADDSESNRHLLKDYLGELGIGSLEATNGQEAVDRAREVKPDLILMDIRMPVMDGLDATIEIKSDASTKHIPVVAVTASVMKQEQEKTQHICDSVLMKPVSRLDLVSCLVQYLEYKTKEAPNKKPAQQPVPEVHHKNGALSGNAELLATLNGYLKTCDELEKTLTINEIEEFAELMLSIGNEYNWDAMSHWARTLKDQAELFEIEELEKTLRKYSQLIDSIK